MRKTIPDHCNERVNTMKSPHTSGKLTSTELLEVTFQALAVLSKFRHAAFGNLYFTIQR